MYTLERFVGWGLPSLSGAIALPLAVIVALLFVDVPMALASTASVVASVPAFRWTVRRFAALAGTRQDLQAQTAARVVEYVQGIAVIRAFNQAGPRQERFRQALDELRDVDVAIVKRVAPTYSAFTTVVDLGVALVLLSSAYWLFGGRIDAGTAIVFLVLVMAVYRPLLDVADRTESLPLVAASLQRLARIFDAPMQPQPEQATPLERFDVAFDQVSFSYEPGVPVRSDVGFTAPERR